MEFFTPTGPVLAFAKVLFFHQIKYSLVLLQVMLIVETVGKSRSAKIAKNDEFHILLLSNESRC